MALLQQVPTSHVPVHYIIYIELPISELVSTWRPHASLGRQRMHVYHLEGYANSSQVTRKI